MPFVGLCSWSYNGFGETLVFFHAIRQFHTAQFPTPFLIFTPSRASKDWTNDHLYTGTFTFQTYGHHGIGCGQFPVRADVGREVKKLGRNLIQYLTLKRDALGQDYVESRYSVGCYHHDFVAINVINIATFTMIHALLSSEVKIGLCQCFHLYLYFMMYPILSPYFFLPRNMPRRHLRYA